MTKVKICGLTCEEDVAAVNSSLPDFAGFVFAKGSKRTVSPEQAKKLRQVLDRRINAVGVFVNQNLSFISAICKENIIDCIQLHGNENEHYIKTLKKSVSQKIIKAFPIEGKLELTDTSADFILFDSKSPARGGTGKTFDWNLLPDSITKPFFLAGGLDTVNIDRAMTLGAYCLDVSSSVETDGHKDAVKVSEFIKKTRMADNMKTSKKPGRFGEFGGQYIPETLMNTVCELDKAYNHYKNDANFNAELKDLLNNYANRPSRLYHAKRMSEDLSAKVYIKREDLNHTGSHKINNVLGQTLLAKKMGKTRVIAETGAGQHGVATATAAALLGLECEVFMGKEDTERQALNVYRMRLLGAKVHVVTSGSMTLKDAVNETMREWSNRVSDTHYVLGSVMGPHPFPTMVRDFQSVIGKEIKEQLFVAEGRLPDAVLACVGGGSNAMGAFYNFIKDPSVKLVGCEAAGKGIDTEMHAASIAKGSTGILHGMKSIFCQNGRGQITPVYSISAGLDYPGIGPEHAYLHQTGRAEYVPITDDEAIAAFEYLSRTEGIIPAIESAHAVAYAIKLSKAMSPDDIMVICLSGRGDKDVAAIARYKGEEIYE